MFTRHTADVILGHLSRCLAPTCRSTVEWNADCEAGLLIIRKAGIQKLDCLITSRPRGRGASRHVGALLGWCGAWRLFTLQCADERVSVNLELDCVASGGRDDAHVDAARG
jgi:hypothetical protein